MNQRGANSDAQKPKIIGYFSTAGNGDLKNDARSLRVINSQFYPQSHGSSIQVNMYLALGFSTDVYRGSRHDNYDVDPPLMRHLNTKNYTDFFKKNRNRCDPRPIPFDVVTSRGCLRMLMKQPYNEYNEDVKIIAQKYNGTIYLSEKYSDIEEAQYAQENLSYSSQRLTYTGEYFEEATTLPFRNNFEYKGTGDDRDHYYCVFTNKIGPFTLLYSGEMDAVKSEDSDLFDPNEYIEIKTKTALALTYPEREHKSYATWWGQCYLSGMDEIVIGYRDRNCYCTTIKKYNMKQIERRGYFEKEKSIESLVSHLKIIKSIIDKKEDGAMISLETNHIDRLNDPGYEKYSIVNNHFKEMYRL